MPSQAPRLDIVRPARYTHTYTIANNLYLVSFLCWAFSSYPQPIINFQRKSVTGLSLDYFTINILGHSCYTVSCLAFLYSETVRDQYRRRWGSGVGDPTVRLNDLAFTAHALLWSCFTITQFYWWGYTRLPSQRLSRGMTCLILGSLASIALATGLVIFFPSKDVGSDEPYAGGWEWLDVIYLMGHIKLLISVIKYYPQAHLNYVNKSTRGWSIHKCLMDFIGSIFSLIQLFIDASLTPGGLGSVIGNPLKFLLGWISVVFDIVFGLQHWVFYPAGKGVKFGDERRIVGRDDEEERGLLPDGSRGERE
ncbi:hypothetical protein L211DRAFT_787054 [Terfezia boudieri ATCC MYA-4762]|uniref:L-cystine transporter-like protein n=1 Tax=Terfezia boudieri ATCC MYA-4762 TaxID=1051890 RepID=A0A3N4LZ48_9PEZI|nr:hypothetical protein L211DRAFT_787054 [Terfezia boudieri ATCC MYA-4762]